MDLPRTTDLSRRTLIRMGTVGLTGALIAGRAGAAERMPIDVGAVEGERVTFPPIDAPTEAKSEPPPAPTPPGSRIGFAIAGLGRLSLEELLPAFGECRHARPVALVSGSPEKARAVAGQYGIAETALYDYESFDRIADDPAVQVVYVVTPNALHRDLVLRAAAAGKHVLCEKPMATSSAEAREMVEACAKAGVKLMIAYRSQYQKHHQRIIRAARTGEFGAVKMIEATNVQNQGDPAQWRLKKALAGGGSLPDIGIYCLNAARYITGEEPVEVTARIWSTPGVPRFAEVEEAVAFTLRFPSGVLASLSTSYGAHKSQQLLVGTERAALRLDKAFAYRGQQLHIAGVRDGGNVDENPEIEAGNQFAAEIDHMAVCVRDDRRPRTPGEEGLQDHVLMEAIYEAGRSGRAVTLPPAPGLDTTRGPMPEDEG